MILEVAILDVIGGVGAHVGDISLVGIDGENKIRDIEVYFVDPAHCATTIDELGSTDVTVLRTIDVVMEAHRGGSIATHARVALDSLSDLRRVYTPGVARVCAKIAEDPSAAWDYTAIGHKVAIVSNGTAVLGLGDIGPLASLPVMEGKAAIFSKFVGLSAEPMLIDSKDPQTIIDTVARCAAGYGAIQLEDIAAPACFEVERGLQKILDKPVFHDDQHGTATVCVAGLTSALQKVGRSPAACEAVVLGSGAAGSAITRFLLEFGVADVVMVDSAGAVYEGRTDKMNDEKAALAAITNRNRVQGSLAEVMRGRNLFVGVSRPNLVTPDMVASMGKDPIVFALANPVSEISVSAARQAGAAVAMDGRGTNNALAYPGIFRGALMARARRITRPR